MQLNAQTTNEGQKSKCEVRESLSSIDNLQLNQTEVSHAELTDLENHHV